MSGLADIIDFLSGSQSVQDKVKIRGAYAPALRTVKTHIKLGDDCAAIPDGNGYLLLAGEAMLPAFVDESPWFAGYSAVMVNVSDISAMGGWPIAIVDMLWSPDYVQIQSVWEGMQAAAAAYGVPIVGGHTTLTRGTDPVYVAASILGRARKLMTSFDAKPGDSVLVAIDLKGHYRDGETFWNASVGTDPETLQRNIRLLSQLSERGWCRACKDISNGGLIGTLIMLLECSSVGARLLLESVPIPPDADLKRWLVSFPSYGYVMSVAPERTVEVQRHFEDREIACKVVGEIIDTPGLDVVLGGECRRFWTMGARSGA